MSIDESLRRQIARAARRPRLRKRGNFSPGRPTKWQPTQVIDPAAGLDGPFTNAGAWELIASKLDHGHDVEVINLRKPRGARGYVMKIRIDPNAPMLYVKVEFRAGSIIGRSFHYSEHE